MLRAREGRLTMVFILVRMLSLGSPLSALTELDVAAPPSTMEGRRERRDGAELGIDIDGTW